MTRPLPIVVRIRSGLGLRGHEWPVDGPPVAFLHDFGEDLDVWGSLPGRVAALGFRVMSLELRGHGLSDGTADPATLEEDTRQLVAELRATFGPIGLVCHGAAAGVAFRLSAEDGAPAHIVVSPLPGPLPIDPDDTTAAVRLIVSGTLHQPSNRYLNEVYARIRGQKLRVTTAAEEHGPQLLLTRPHLVEHMTTFLRRYLPGHDRAGLGTEVESGFERVRAR